MRLALSQVMEQRGLLEQLAWLTLELSHGLEHVEAMALIIDRELEEQDRERSEASLRHRPLLRCDAGRCMTPELANSMHRGTGHSSPSVSGRPHRSFRRSSSKKFRPPLNCTRSHCKPGGGIPTS